MLAGLAREVVPRLLGTAEDSEEDLLLRLRDPRVFGGFVESVGDDPRVNPSLRRAMVEHVFDLLPLPRTEGEVIAVETRAPRHLLSLAASLAAADGLSVLHVMHIVYAVFLDRSLVAEVPRRTRSALLRAVVAERESGEGLRVLYASLHLSAIPEPEAASEFRRILKAPSVSPDLRRVLATVAAANDGGLGTLTRLAQREGLLPDDLKDADAPSVLASIPRLPTKLSAVAQRYLSNSS